MRFVRPLVFVLLFGALAFGLRAEVKKQDKDFNPETILLGRFSFKRPPNWQWMHTEPGQRNDLLTELTFHVMESPESDRYATVLMNHFKPNADHALPENVVKRWKNWFVELREFPSESVKIGEHKVTFVEFAGGYLGPTTTTKKKHPSANYKLYGAIIEDEGGNVIGRFYGPEKLVEKYKKDFRGMIENAVKEE